MAESEQKEAVTSATADKNKLKKQTKNLEEKQGKEEIKKDSSSDNSSSTSETSVSKADILRYQTYVGQKWTGVCKWYNVKKGFGFILPDNDEAKQHKDEVFVHQVCFYFNFIIFLDSFINGRFSKFG